MITVQQAIFELTALGVRTLQSQMASRAAVAAELVRLACELIGYDAVVNRVESLRRAPAAPESDSAPEPKPEEPNP